MCFASWEKKWTLRWISGSTTRTLGSERGDPSGMPTHSVIICFDNQILSYSFAMEGILFFEKYALFLASGAFCLRTLFCGWVLTQCPSNKFPSNSHCIVAKVHRTKNMVNHTSLRCDKWAYLVVIRWQQPPPPPPTQWQNKTYNRRVLKCEKNSVNLIKLHFVLEKTKKKLTKCMEL